MKFDTNASRSNNTKPSPMAQTNCETDSRFDLGIYVQRVSMTYYKIDGGSWKEGSLNMNFSCGVDGLMCPGINNRVVTLVDVQGMVLIWRCSFISISPDHFSTFLQSRINYRRPLLKVPPAVFAKNSSTNFVDSRSDEPTHTT